MSDKAKDEMPKSTEHVTVVPAELYDEMMADDSITVLRELRDAQIRRLDLLDPGPSVA